MRTDMARRSKATNSSSVAASASTAAHVELPPYGFLNTRQAQVVGSPTYIPTAFLPHESSDTRIDRWNEWANVEVELLENAFAPRWGHAGWQKAWLCLTQADLSVMQHLTSLGIWKTLLTNPPLTAKHHSDAFLPEDFNKPTESVTMYLPSGVARASDLELLDYVGQISRERFLGDISLRLKSAFQRPRPHQAAFLLSKTQTDFRFLSAISAYTPAFCSGHAIDYAIYFAAGAEAMAGSGASSELQSACASCIVDVGDRRVLAGLHYPSDNMASWITLARLLKHFKERGLLARLKRAVDGSFVLKAVRAHDASQSSVSAYSRGLKALEDALK